MMKILHIIKKEFIEIARDYQSFLVLIIMPTAFILVMSLSMQALFQSHSDFKISMLAIDQEGSPESKALIDSLKKVTTFSVSLMPPGTPAEAVSGEILAGRYRFAVIVRRGYAAYSRDLNSAPESMPVSLLVDPTMQMLTQMVVRNMVQLEIIKLRLDSFMGHNEAMLGFVGLDRKRMLASIQSQLPATYIYRDRHEAIIPSAAQQSVPAWLVFSMYYIVIPISTIFFTEKNNGTLQRLRSINVAGAHIIGGKLASYYLIGLIQAICMLAVGRYLVPLLGGDTISLGNSYAGLFLIITCVSLNAIAYGILVSVSSKSIAMASALGVVAIVIFAAIGGIMIPTFVMPGFMQNMAHASPLFWGMEGFLDIMLRNGTIIDILPECGILAGTSLAMLVASGIVLRKKKI